MKTHSLSIAATLTRVVEEIMEQAQQQGGGSLLAEFEREELNEDRSNVETCGEIVVRVCIVPAATVPKVYAMVEKARAKMREGRSERRPANATGRARRGVRARALSTPNATSSRW